MKPSENPSWRVLCYGDSNTWGYATAPGSMTVERLPAGQRWPDVMAQALGPGVVVQVNAVNGRRSNVDGHPDMALNRGVGVQAFNGWLGAEPAAMSASPLDAIVLMLGTNDLVLTPPRTAPEIAAAVAAVGEALLRGASAFCSGPAPRMLLVSPAPLGGEGQPREEVPGWPQAWQLSRALGAAMDEEARQHGWTCLDAARHIEADAHDLVHLSAASHRRLGLAVANSLRSMMALKPGEAP